MENLIFVGFVFALGLLIFWLNKYFEARRLSSNSRYATDKQPLPPRKRTVSGPNPVEEVQIAFQQRIDNWQRSHFPAFSSLRNSEGGLSGQKYQPEPGSLRRLNGSSRPERSERARPRFQLLG